MTRIVSGTAGGRRLRTPPGDRVRPTSERVREALFSMLESGLGGLSGLRFLDLYAGSGAVGLEAASRGAAAVTLVERDRRTADLARLNARSVAADLEGVVEVACAPVARFLAAAPATAYDVVYLDPPYAQPRHELAADLDALPAGWLAAHAVVVVEHATRAGAPGWPPGYADERIRRYGETSLSPARWVG